MRCDDVQHIIGKHNISTCTISDVLDGMGLSCRVLDDTLHRVSGGTKTFCGQAFPVNWVTVRKGPSITASSPSTWAQVRDFLLPGVNSGRGRVYVAGAGQIVTDAALAGGLSITYLSQNLQFEGVVLGGAVRDRDMIRQSEIPVVASNFIPVDTQGAFRVESYGKTCIINNVTVTSEDWVISDGNGTVLVPPSAISEALRRAAAIEQAEDKILKRIASGEELPAIIDEVGRI
jgi:regulator of RNase E activity RraA